MNLPHPEYNIWEHTRETLFDLYARRARGETEELTCHRQCFEILSGLIEPGMSLLDAGCGAGDLYWSFHRRGFLIDYHGLDYTRSFIDLGRANFPPGVLSPEALTAGTIENLTGRYDVVCCINTLQCCADFREPLERLCRAARHAVYLRATFDDAETIRYETDDFLDAGYRGRLRSYFNIFALDTVAAFLESEGFAVSRHVDQRTQDGVEISAGKPFPWKILVGVRRRRLDQGRAS